MAVESATYIDDLNDSYPPGSDPRSQGDDHLRLIKNVLKATFPNTDDVFTDLAHTWAEVQTFSKAPIVVSVDAGATAGPDFTLFRNSASPADADRIGRLIFSGRNDTPGNTTYAAINASIVDASGSTEDGKLEFGAIEAGTFSYDLYLTGSVLGPTVDEGLDLGTSSVRFGVGYLDTLQARDGGVLGDASGDAVTIKGTVVSAYMAGLFSTSSTANLRSALGLGTGDTVTFATVNLGTSLLLGGVNPFNDNGYAILIANNLGLSGQVIGGTNPPGGTVNARVLMKDDVDTNPRWVRLSI